MRRPSYREARIPGARFFDIDLIADDRVESAAYGADGGAL